MLWNGEIKPYHIGNHCFSFQSVGKVQYTCLWIKLFFPGEGPFFPSLMDQSALSRSDITDEKPAMDAPNKYACGRCGRYVWPTLSETSLWNNKTTFEDTLKPLCGIQNTLFRILKPIWKTPDALWKCCLARKKYWFIYFCLSGHICTRRLSYATSATNVVSRQVTPANSVVENSSDAMFWKVTWRSAWTSRLPHQSTRPAPRPWAQPPTWPCRSPRSRPYRPYLALPWLLFPMADPEPWS